MLRVVNLIVFAFSLLIPMTQSGMVHAETPLPTLIFTEIKVRTDTINSTDYDEFIEIYNASSQPVDLANYNLEYYNATNPASTQQPSQKPIANYLLEANASLTLAKQPIQIANSKQSPFSSLSDSGGRLRLVTSEGVIVDEVAWTNTQSNATVEGVYPSVVYQCNSSTILCNSNRSLSLSRSQNTDGTFMLLNPTWLLAAASPVSNELVAYPTPDPEPQVPTPDPVTNEQQNVPQITKTCEGILLSELLPNPAGSDIGNEFIELYNPTGETINLLGCSLQTSSSTRKYNLPDISVPAGVYVIFADGVTGLVLPNGAGGSVWLLSPNDELSTVTYPGGIEDNASWALIDGVWQITYMPTPAAQNISAPMKPCPTGQTRNTDTNRCQAPVVVATATLAPCKTGQERNPDTGRCRSIASTASSLVVCRQGQERNPETNRCRSIATTNSVAACDEGQERNPETNRCRKITSNSGNTLAAVTDVPSKTVNQPKWWLAVFAVAIAFGYAAFEWRNDVRFFISKVIAKVKSR